MALCRHHQLLLMSVHHVNALLELHHFRHVSGRCASPKGQDEAVDLVHTIAYASTGKPIAGGAVSMPLTLVEDCSAPSVDRVGNRKLTFDVVASGIIIAFISQQSASCSSVNHARFAVECLNHQTSEAKSVWRVRAPGSIPTLTMRSCASTPRRSPESV